MSIRDLAKRSATLRRLASLGSSRAQAGVDQLGQYTERALQDLRNEVSRLENEIRLLQIDTVGLRSLATVVNTRYDSLRTDLALERARLKTLLTDERTAVGEDINTLPSMAEATGREEEVLYLAFEEQFRGSRNLVRDLVGVYLEDVRHLQAGGGVVVDVGSGRGEWLEVLQDNGIAAYGLETNAVAVEMAHSRGLDVRAEDAFSHLRDLPAASVGAVTAFHVLEHMDSLAQRRFVEEVLRVLVPGGTLIIETPNPANVRVGSFDFHLDPTHVRPVHHLYLKFVLTYLGMAVDVRFLHPPNDALPKVGIPGKPGEDLGQVLDRLNELLYGPRDFAIVATKAAEVS